jgi:hypothetical protein
MCYTRLGGPTSISHRAHDAGPRSGATTALAQPTTACCPHCSAIDMVMGRSTGYSDCRVRAERSSRRRGRHERAPVGK